MTRNASECIIRVLDRSVYATGTVEIEVRGGRFFHCFSKRTRMSPDHGKRCSDIQIWLNKNKIQAILRVLSSSSEAPALPNQPFAVIAANRITAPLYAC